MLAYPTLLTRSYRNAVLNSSGLLGYWPFGDPSGTVAKDELGIWNGTYVTTPTLGAVGALSGNPSTSVTFNGSTQYATVAAGFLVGDVFTLAIWIKRGRTGVAAEFIMESGNDSGTALQIAAAGGGTGDLLRAVKAGTGEIGVSTVGITDTTTWHFVSWTRRGSMTDRLFLDGVDVSGTITTRDSMSMTGVRFASAVGYSHFQGSQAHPAIWNRALAPAELSNLYRIGRGF